MGTLGTYQAIGDALRRRRPDALNALIQSFPVLQDSLANRRVLGAENTPASSATPRGLLELASLSSAEAHKDLDEVLSKLTRRARALARLRLGSGVISTVVTAGLIALLLGPNKYAQISTAIVGFLASVLALASTYLEDFSGGEGSIRRLRDALSGQVRALSETEGRVKIAQVRSDEIELIDILKSLNGILAEIQFARAQLGMSI
jgi:hypothetical protein